MLNMDVHITVYAHTPTGLSLTGNLFLNIAILPEGGQTKTLPQ